MDHSITTELHRRLEEQLKTELGQTRAAYYAAKAEATWLQRYYADLGMGQQDGIYALRKAVNAQHRTTVAYREALVRFNRFILDGELPGDFVKAKAP